MTFIKQLKPRQHKDEDPYSLSTSPNTQPPYLHPSSPTSNEKTRPKLHHMSRSSNAVATIKSPSYPAVGPYEYQCSIGSSSNGIFGVSLEESVSSASASIQIRDKYNQNAVGKIPVIVANCARFLKKDATRVEGIFRLSGSARRIKELQVILTDPAQDYGKNLDWTPYTVHDAANLLRRYLNNLPEPIIPLDFYNSFREPLNHYPGIVEHLQGKSAISATTPPASAAMSPVMKSQETDVSIPSLPLSQSLLGAVDLNEVSSKAASVGETKPQPPVSFDETASSVDKLQLKKETKKAIREYRDLIDQLPILNQQLLLYILDLIFTFSQESEKNLMPAVNLASIFQPSILSHPSHDMSPKEYHLSRAVTQFLIEQFPKLASAVHTWTPSAQLQRNNTLIPPGSRRHSKSMSSVNVPSSLNDIDVIIGASQFPIIATSVAPVQEVLAQNEIKPQVVKEAEQAKHPMFRRPSRQSIDSFSDPSSSRNSPLVSPMEKPAGGFFQALKRGASFSRRRTSSSSTNSSIFGLDMNTSNTSLSNQRAGRSGSITNQRPGATTNHMLEADKKQESDSQEQVIMPIRLRSIPSGLMSEPKQDTNNGVLNEPAPYSNSAEANPPKKSSSTVTITANNAYDAKIPPRTTAIAKTPAQLSQPANEFSEIESSEAETSQSEFSDRASKPLSRGQYSPPKKHRRSISSLLSRRSGSPALSLSQSTAFRKIDNNRLFSSTSELPISIDSALASPGAVSTSAQSLTLASPGGLSTSAQSLNGSMITPSEAPTSPRVRALAFFSGGHSNDSGSSIGVESDEDRSNLGGPTEALYIGRGGTSSSSSRRNVSRWRRSLMALNIPIPSPDSVDGEVRNPLASPGHTFVEPLAIPIPNSTTSPLLSEDPQSAASSPGSRWLRKLSRRKRGSGLPGPTTVDTSDSGFSS